MGFWLSRLTVKLLAFLRLTVNFLPLRLILSRRAFSGLLDRGGWGRGGGLIWSPPLNSKNIKAMTTNCREDSMSKKVFFEVRNISWWRHMT